MQNNKLSKYFKAVSAVFLILTVVIFSIVIFYSVFPKSYGSTIEKYCDMYDIEESLVYALIKAESNFCKTAISSAGAKGLMQLTDETFSFCAQKLGISEKDCDIFDPDTNLQAGIWYLSYMLEKYHGNTQNAIAAYNAGASTVDKWLKSSKNSYDGKTLHYIPYKETKRHVEKIEKYKIIYNLLY